MKTLTAEEFLKITEENPEWAKTLTENVTITGEVILPKGHPLKALSPKLTFQDYAIFQGSQISVAEGVFHKGVNFSHSQVQEIGELNVLGTDEDGNAATFWKCKNLTVARGTFPGYVSFTYSGIQQITDDFQITAPDKDGYAANFWGCEKLTIARGTFPGFVDFSRSGIQEIAKDFRVTAPDKEGDAANFLGCERLTIARGTFPGFVSFAGSRIQEIEEELNITAPNKKGNAASFEACKHLTVASGKFRGTVNFTETPITHAQKLEIKVPSGIPKAIFTEPCLKELPFPPEEIDIPEELLKKLRPRKLHKNLENTSPNLSLEL